MIKLSEVIEILAKMIEHGNNEESPIEVENGEIYFKFDRICVSEGMIKFYWKNKMTASTPVEGPYPPSNFLEIGGIEGRQRLVVKED